MTLKEKALELLWQVQAQTDTIFEVGLETDATTNPGTHISDVKEEQ
eukprot:CAMPEP_0183412514 /NCGR_PEP_ID=MMETSP0370-20130417/21072_1 /TAXON_ID=268820 /ORGANISM="Peridinium aciculiferum, Strain PAER-2" /LENGTH=45 /DNA_ID= /DNA_START= /DNA_END= /DNA_ORIENTATION=